MKAKDGDVRVRRYDEFNFVIETAKLEQPTVKYKGDEIPNKKAGEITWTVDGWYGNNLVLALKEAVRHGLKPQTTDEIIKELKRVEALLIESVKTIKLEIAEEPEPQVAEAPKKRGRKPKN
jgi:hypothetical protein